MRTAALLAALCLALPIGSEAKEAKEAKDSRAHLLTRSIYLPVEIRLCGHLRDAVLYQDGQAVSLLPARRIIQFTYYPALSRVEPLKSELRVEGRRSDGSDFVRNLAVTPWGVFAAGQRFELDMKEQLDKMKFHLDTRYYTVNVRIRCTDSCGRADAVAEVGSPLEQ